MTLSSSETWDALQESKEKKQPLHESQQQHDQHDAQQNVEPPQCRAAVPQDAPKNAAPPEDAQLSLFSPEEQLRLWHLRAHASNPDAIRETVHEACVCDDVELLELVVKDVGMGFLMRNVMVDSKNRSLFWRACYFGSNRVLEALAEYSLEYFFSQAAPVPQEKSSSRQLLVQLLELETKWGSTPLLVAAAANHGNCISILLQNGLDPNKTNQHGMTSSAMAACRNAVSALRALGCSSKKVDFNLSQDVLLASRQGSVEALQFLWEYRQGIDTVVDFSVVDKEGYNAVGLAAIHNQPHVIAFLSDLCQQQRKCADLNHVFNGGTGHAWNGDRPIHLASRQDSSANAVTALLQSKCRKTALNAVGRTALHVAVQENNPRVVACFAALPPADLAWFSVEDMVGMTPLYLACWLGHAEVVQLLAPLSDWSIMCRVVHDEHHHHHRQTPLAQPALLAAVEQNHVECVSGLLAAGANVNQTDEAGHTAILVAAKLGCYLMCKVLVTSGADLSLQSSKQGGTPLQKARKYKHYDIVELLEKYGGK